MNIHRINSKTDDIVSYINKFNYKSNYTNKNINKIEFLSNLYHINLLIFNLYKIYNNKNMNKKQKINMIQNLKDTDGNIFLTEKQAKYIYENNGKKITKFYKNLYKLRDNSLKKGYNDIMYGGNTKHNVKKCKNYNKIKGLISKIDINKFINDNSVLLNWIFFPLWSLENLPTVGTFFEIPLDILGIILDFTDIFLEPLSPLIGPITGSLIDVAQAVPGAGTFVSAAAIPLNFAEEGAEYFLENGADLIGMYINISRKQWALAYISALECVPLFAATVDSYLTNATTANKYLKRINYQTENIKNLILFIDQRISTYEPMIHQVLENPKIIIEPELIFKNIILPNKHNIPGLNNISQDEIYNIQQFLKKIDPYIKNTIRQPLVYIRYPEKYYYDIIYPFQEKFPLLHNSILTIINIILKNIIDSMKLYNCSSCKNK